MTLARNQEQIEKELSDILPHGIREAIARGTGIYPKIVDAYFNPFDERKSPHFTVLHIQSVIDAVDPATGEAVWQRLNELREESRPHEVKRRLNVEHELGSLSKEFSDVIIAKCEGKPITVQLREIHEMRSQLNRYEDSLHLKAGETADAVETVN